MEVIDRPDDEISTMVDMKWESEQEKEEPPALPEMDYNTPRLVLISSKISWCYSLAGALKTDENVLHVIYDFDKWSFDNILAECQRLLDNFKPGCTAKSLLLICKGGPGYLYLLKNFVMTPQKLAGCKYKSMSEFWDQMSHMICDVTTREANVHIFGEILDQSTQGHMMKAALCNALQPYRTSVEAVCDNSISGHNLLLLYFDYRKFLLWKSLTDMNFDLPRA